MYIICRKEIFNEDCNLEQVLTPVFELGVHRTEDSAKNALLQLVTEEYNQHKEWLEGYKSKAKQYARTIIRLMNGKGNPATVTIKNIDGEVGVTLLIDKTDMRTIPVWFNLSVYKFTMLEGVLYIVMPTSSWKEACEKVLEHGWQPVPKYDIEHRLGCFEIKSIEEK